MMDPDELPDFIFNELLPVSKLYRDDKSIEKIHTFNIHLNESNTIVKTALTAFLNKVKGIIRYDECSYLEVIGPHYVKQTCFLTSTNHDHIQVIVKTRYDDPYSDL